MNFGEAVQTTFSQYALFSGRARRSQYWYFVLFYVIVLVVAAILDGVLGTYPLLYGLAALAMFLPNLSLTVRRLHDIGKSGWFVLIGFIPLVGAILLIVWACTDSVPDNQYGPNPKNAGMGAYSGQANPYGA